MLCNSTGEVSGASMTSRLSSCSFGNSSTRSSKKFSDRLEWIAWARAVATAIVAIIIVQLVLVPSGEMGTVTSVVQSGAMIGRLLVYYCTSGINVRGSPRWRGGVCIMGLVIYISELV